MDEIYFAQAFDKAAVGMAFLENDGKVMSANPALINTLGKDIWLVVGSPLDDHLKPDDALRWNHFFSEFTEGKAKDYYFESIFLPLEKREAWWSIQLGDIGMDWGGKRIYFAVIQDITLKKVNEQKLREARYQAESASRAKSQFLANMSHEIRTPLFTITGMADLLRTGPLASEQSHYAGQIFTAAQLLLELVNDILDFSKIEAGQMTIESIPVDLDEVISQSLEVVTLAAYKKGIELLLDLDPSVPRSWIGDPGRLRQILVNLLSNAVKFTAKGRVTLRVRHQEQDPSGKESLHFRVEDTGMGINEASRDTLFQVFAQGDSSTTRQFGGSGLGLAICQKLVRLLGGEIGYHSVEGKGTEFFFSVLMYRNQDPELAWGSQGGGREILVVDNDEGAREILETVLRLAGFRVRTASGGGEALTIITSASDKSTFAAFIIDQDLPGMDGSTLALQLKDSFHIDAPMLLMTVLRKTFDPSPRFPPDLFQAILDKPPNPRHLVEILLQGFAGHWPDRFAQPKWSVDDTRSDEEAVSVEEVPLGGRALVAEDNDVNRELFQLLLRKLGHEVRLTSNGKEACDQAPDFSPDLIFMDLQMPEMNGYEASQKLRKKGIVCPIIAVTASAVKGELERCLKAGMNGILTKPFNLQDLQEVLKTFAPQLNRTLDRGSTPVWIGPQSIEAELPDLHEPTEPVFSLESALDVFLGNRELVLSLIRRFLPRTRETLQQLSHALDRGDFEEAAKAAHAIKGSALNLTAVPLGNLAEKMQVSARERRIGECSLYFPALEDAYKAFEAAVLPLLEEGPSKSS